MSEVVSRYVEISPEEEAAELKARGIAPQSFVPPPPPPPPGIGLRDVARAVVPGLSAADAPGGLSKAAGDLARVVVPGYGGAAAATSAPGGLKTAANDAAKVLMPGYGVATMPQEAPPASVDPAFKAGAGIKPPAGPDVRYAEPRGPSQAVQPQVVPAHEVALVDPRRQAAESEAIEGEKGAEQEIADAEKVGLGAKAQGNERLASANFQAAGDVQDRAAESRQRHEDYLRKMDAFSSALADDKIDPDRLWNSKNTAQKIAWGVAQFLGGVSQGILHLPTNQIADRLDKLVAEDIEAQKANHQIKRGRMQDMQSLYAMARAGDDDDLRATQIAYGYGLEAVKAQVQALVDAAGSPMAQAKGDSVIAQLTEKQAQRGIAENKWVPAGVAGGGGKPVDAGKVFFDPVTHQYYSARTEDSRKKLSEASQAVGNIGKAAAAYSDALAEVTNWDKAQAKLGIITPAMSRAKAAHISLLDDVRQANQEGGVIREGLMKSGIYEDSILSPETFTGDPQAQMATVKNRVRNLHDSMMEVEAPIPVVEAPQPIGTAPKSVPTGQNYEAPRRSTPRSAGFLDVPHAKGGGMSKKDNQDKPYLVGEKGPELVIPNKPGYVMTAHQTAALLGGGKPTAQQRYYMKAMGLDPDDADVAGKRDLGGLLSGGGISGGSTMGINGNSGAGQQAGQFAAFNQRHPGVVDNGGNMATNDGFFSKRALAKGGSMGRNFLPKTEHDYVKEYGEAREGGGSVQYLGTDEDPDKSTLIWDQDKGQIEQAGIGGTREGKEGKAGPAPSMSWHPPPAPARKESAAPSRPAGRRMTDDEMSAEADRQIAQYKAANDRIPETQPAVQGSIDRSGGSAPAPWLEQYMAGQREEGGPVESNHTHLNVLAQEDNPRPHYTFFRPPATSVSRRVGSQYGGDSDDEAGAASDYAGPTSTETDKRGAMPSDTIRRLWELVKGRVLGRREEGGDFGTSVYEDEAAKELPAKDNAALVAQMKRNQSYADAGEPAPADNQPVKRDDGKGYVWTHTEPREYDAGPGALVKRSDYVTKKAEPLPPQVQAQVDTIHEAQKGSAPAQKTSYRPTYASRLGRADDGATGDAVATNYRASPGGYLTEDEREAMMPKAAQNPRNTAKVVEAKRADEPVRGKYDPNARAYGGGIAAHYGRKTRRYG